MNRLSPRQYGFTLLEIMLVAALIAVVAVTAISFYESKIRDVKIDKAALQMQQYLQAAMAYYANHSGNPKPWPDDLNQLVQTGYLPKNPTDVTALGPANNPWGLPYTGSIIGTTKYFTVTTTLPPDLPHAAEIGARIAAELPLASVDNSQAAQVTISAQVTPPGQAIMPLGSTYVVWAGELVANTHGSTTDQLPSSVHCPDGLVLHTYTALSQISMIGNADTSPIPFQLTSGLDDHNKMQVRVSGSGRCASYNDTNNCSDTIDPPVATSLGDDNHPEKLMVIATCEVVSPPVANTMPSTLTSPSQPATQQPYQY